MSGLTARVASHRLIGRSGELAALEAALADAAEGRPSLAFVAGESGVGKTRLLAELERRAREGGALVLTGEASTSAARASCPTCRWSRRCGRSRARRPGADRAAARGRRAAAPGPRPAPDGRPRHRRQARLFEGLLALLDALGAERPVLLVIEDLHWADRSTQAALAFLARSLTAERVLIVASYRPDELHRSHPLRPLLAESSSTRAPAASRSSRSRATSWPSS